MSLAFTSNPPIAGASRPGDRAARQRPQPKTVNAQAAPTRSTRLRATRTAPGRLHASGLTAADFTARAPRRRLQLLDARPSRRLF
jgi:hypothetical protein